MNVPDRLERLTTWLTAYSATCELLVLSVLAGGNQVKNCRHLAKFQAYCREVLPDSGAKPVLLATCHVRLIVALCRVRETRVQPLAYHFALQELELARRDHRAVVQELFNDLRDVYSSRRT